MEGVEKVTHVMKPFKLSSRDSKPDDPVIPLNGTQYWGQEDHGRGGTLFGGEPSSRLLDVAWALKEAGVHISTWRGVQASDFSLQLPGTGHRGAGDSGRGQGAERDLRSLSEVMGAEQVPLVARYADMLQVGTRNMQNFNLLHAAGESGKPVLLKRGMMSTIEELLMSAEYILSHKNYQVILCERGIRTFETATTQHARSERHSGPEESVSPTGNDRPKPRHGALGVGSCHVQGIRSGGRRRPAD